MRVTHSDVENGPLTFTVTDCEQIMSIRDIPILRLWFKKAGSKRYYKKYYDCYSNAEILYVVKRAGNGKPVETTDEIIGKTFTVHGVCKGERKTVQMFRNLIPESICTLSEFYMELAK